MQGKFAINFDKIKDGFQFQLREYQINIVQRVFSHFEENKKHQTIMLPVGSGKTVIAQLIALSFADAGYKVLLVNEGMNQQYLYEQNTYFKEYVDNGSITLAQQTKLWLAEVGKIDIVIADVVRARIDSSLQIQNVINNALEALQRTPYQQLSIGQRSALGIKKIYDILQKQDSFLIEFESTQGQQIMHAPVLALSNIVSIQLTPEDLRAYESSVVRETDMLYRRKANAILSGDSHNEAPQYDYYIDELGKLFDGLEERLGRKIDAVGQDVKDVLNIVNEINHKITRQLDDSKRILSIFSDIHPADDDEATLFSARIIDDFCDRIISDIESIQKQGVYERCTAMLRVSMGEEAWEKISAKAKKFLISAKVFLNQNIALGDIMDYSSICLLASKAYEAELAQRLYTDYLDYARAQYSNVNDWPPALFKKNRYGDEEVIALTDVTLGTILAIVGAVGSNNDKNDNIRFFRRYCKTHLLKQSEDRRVDEAIELIVKHTRNIKDKYRNPAAHKDAIPMEAAIDCMSYIVEVEKALRNTLELFRV